MLVTILTLISLGLAFFIGLIYSDRFGYALGHAIITCIICSAFTWIMIVPITLTTVTPSGYSVSSSQGVSGVTYLATEDSYLIDVELGGGLRETVRTSDVEIVPGDAKTLETMEGRFDQWTVFPWSVEGFQHKQVLTVPNDMVKVVVK